MAAKSKHAKDKKYCMLGQILNTTMGTINGVVLRDNSTGVNIRATVLEAEELYRNGEVDQPPY